MSSFMRVKISPNHQIQKHTRKTAIHKPQSQGDLNLNLEAEITIIHALVFGYELDKEGHIENRLCS